MTGGDRTGADATGADATGARATGAEATGADTAGHAASDSPVAKGEGPHMDSAGQATMALEIAYDGAPFAGFQIQPDVETVQGRLEAALATVLGYPVSTTCAGRTDAGVHAACQVVSFDIAADLDPGSLARSLNALAGPHVVVRRARRAAPGFSARHDAVARTYRYRLLDGPTPPLFLAGCVWWTKGTLDLDAMRAASRHLLGEHDFASFCVAESARLQPTTRDIARIEIEPETALGEACVAVVIEGRSFLHSMVRIIVGTLVEVGKGRREPAWVAEALAARDRTAAGQTAPAGGLVLERVTYPEDVWL